jgi:predicted RNase H-like nuclease (RuvC/YqgF family)
LKKEIEKLEKKLENKDKTIEQMREKLKPDA